MCKKILVLYQDWGNWFIKDYSIFEYWFKQLDGAYDEKNEYYILAFGNKNYEFQKEKNIFIKIIKSTPQKQILDLFKFKKEVKNVILEFKPQYIYSSFIYLLSTVPKSNDYKIIGFVRDKTAEMVKVKGGIRKFVGEIFYFLDKIAFKKIDLVLYNGKSMKKYAKSLGFKEKFIYCPRPIVDTEFYNSEENNSELIYEKLNIGKKKIILTISRLSEEKNIIMGIKAIKNLSERYIYIIIGNGNLKLQLQKYINDNNLSDRVYLFGFIKHKYLWAYYKSADIFWLLSKSDFEGTPNVLQEAFYSQLPCIVSKIDAMKNIVDDKRNGLILKSWDEKELAEKTQFLINNEILYKKIQKEQKIKIDKIIKQNKKVVEFFK